MSAPIDSATRPASRFRALTVRLLPHASILLGAFAIALIWLGAYVNITREKARDEQAALHNADNLARAFEEQILGSLRSADQALLYFRDSYERNNGQIDVALWARPYRSLTDFVRQIAVIDRDGFLAASNIETPDIVNLSDREHFRVHRERDADELFVSKPVVGRVSGLRTLQLTRRIRRPDGSFGGVMVLSIDPAYFMRFYETIDLGKQGAISLIGTDGVVRAHGSNERVSIGGSIEGGQLLGAFARAEAGHFRTISRTDGVERFVTYRSVQGYPLIVSVDLGADDVFASFYRTRLVRLSAASLLTLALIPLLLLILRYQRGLALARDAAEAGTRARAEFLAVMSHEIRTPMNAVLGFAGSLLESKLDAEQRLTATALNVAGDNLLRILNDILDFSRLDAGRIQLESIPFSPSAVVDTTVSVVASAPPARAWRCASISIPICRPRCSAMPDVCARCCSTWRATRSSSPRAARFASRHAASTARANTRLSNGLSLIPELASRLIASVMYSPTSPRPTARSTAVSVAPASDWRSASASWIRWAGGSALRLNSDTGRYSASV